MANVSIVRYLLCIFSYSYYLTLQLTVINLLFTATGYECPDDFTSVTYTPCRSARGSDVFGEDKELWLIKAPANFDPRR